MAKIAANWTFYILCLLLAGGCGYPKPVATMQEFEQAQTKTYNGVGKSQIESAIEELFTLADPDDVRITREDQKLVARRLSIMFLSSYQETWVMNVQETQGGTKVGVSVDRLLGGGSLPPTGIGQYHLFFTRLDYLLGQSEQWMTCDEYEMAARDHPNWGRGDDILCFAADDHLPEALRPTTAGEM